MSPRTGIGLNVIVDAAASIADRDGLDNVTLKAVAAELGIKAPSLYNYFDGAHGLRRELTLLGLKLLGDTVSEACMGLSGDTAVRTTAYAIRRFAARRPGIYLAGHHSGAQDDDDLIEAGDRVVSMFTAVLRGYGFDGDEAIHAMRVMRNAIHGFVLIEAVHYFRYSADVDTSFERLIDVLILGLNSWPENADEPHRYRDPIKDS
jgi:AcrR family transcriptional regulator